MKDMQRSRETGAREPGAIRSSTEQSARTVDRQVHLLEQLGEEEVEDDDRDEAGDEALRARPAHAAGAAAGGETLVATDQPDRAAEEDALEDALHDLPRIHALRRVIPVRPLRHVQE